MIKLHSTANPTRLKYNGQYPVYNWYYPFCEPEQKIDTRLKNPVLPPQRPQRRALYFHFPFCETICSFCPFTRGTYEEETLDRYVAAIKREIETKKAYFCDDVPVDCIYWGGGTPSVLSAQHIQQLGETIHRNFNLDQLKEWTLEAEVKSVTIDKLKAARDIGVTRVSLGVQTFDERYRALFNLTATPHQIRQAVTWAREHFSYTNVDQIYAMAGQTLDDFLADLEAFVELGTTTIDLYPLNNIASQTRLHRAFAEHGFKPLSANTKLSYRLYGYEYLRAKGLLPINGYSFTNKLSVPSNENKVVSRHLQFLYHDILLGYGDDQVDAYGAGAFGQSGPYRIGNYQDRQTYCESLEAKSPQPWFEVYRCGGDVERGIIYCPYRGHVEKARVRWDQLHLDTATALETAIADGLIKDNVNDMEVTEAGWLFYVNLMYLLMPVPARQKLDQRVTKSYSNSSRQEDDLVLY